MSSQLMEVSVLGLMTCHRPCESVVYRFCGILGLKGFLLGSSWTPLLELCWRCKINPSVANSEVQYDSRADPSLDTMRVLLIWQY